jgi:aarF domain-containing kinase
VALSRTLQDYSPISQFLPSYSVSRRGPTSPEQFSYPGALRKLFERLGATYVKLGQFIASSPSLFPEEYVLEFQKCLDSTEPLSWEEVKSVLEQELGSPLTQHFSHIERTPLASASIAQVHVAKLKSTGEEVVLKVQKPRIDTLLKADLNFIYIASRVLEYIQPDFERTSLSAVAGDVRSSMLEELDFEKEAMNIEEFRLFLQENGLESSVTAPRVYKELTTKRVLTMERLRGVPMTDIESIRGITTDPESLIVTALNTWTSMVMNMPWFHADVHGGNLLVLEDGRVGFIDFGMVGRVGEKTFQAVSELSSSMAMGDYEGMATALLNMGATDANVNVQKFGNDIRQVMENMAMVSPDISAVGISNDGSVRATISFDEGEITNMLLKIVAVTEDNGLRLPREFGLLVKQSLYFDRYLKILAPGLDVTSDARMLALGGDSTDRAGSTEVEVFA